MIINVKDVMVQGIHITVPTWVNWVAFDEDGEGWGYGTAPRKDDGCWDASSDDKEWPQSLFSAKLTNNEKWQDLLFYVGDE